MLELLVAGKRIINIDETWIAKSNFKRMHWGSRHLPMSQDKNVVQPRASMILALDQFGDSYISLSQANTNSSTFRIFVRHLAE